MNCLNAELIIAPAQAMAFMAADRHVGGREYQQDQVVCLSTPDMKYQLLVVADGVGGHWGGGVASKAVIDVAQRLFPTQSSKLADPERFLERFCTAANHEVRVRAARERQEAFSTVVALLTTPLRAYWAHVGDSRLYCFKGANLIHQTYDHSLVQSLFDQGKITAAERATHPDRNRVLHVLGMDDDAARPTLGEIQLTPGMGFVLCTDGFWAHVTETEMAQMLTASELNFAAALSVRHAVRRAGAGGDNVALALWRTPPRAKLGWL